MVDNEKRDNLANARRKLKKFRDQQQTQNSTDHLTFISEPNGNNNIHLINGTTNDLPVSHSNTSFNEPHDLNNFVHEQQAILNGLHANLSKSPIDELEQQNQQYALLLENQKQQRIRLEEQRAFGVGSSLSGRSSQTQSDVDIVRQIEQKYRRDFEHLQEQLEIHVQTIGILVAEKTDITARLTQSIKQIERKQSEIDEIQGRLKASRERVEELEKSNQNSSSSAQKHELAVKESDREIDRLRTDNTRQNQIIEDFKQNLTELNEKLHQRQHTIEQLNQEIAHLKHKGEQSDIRLQQYQSISDPSAVNVYEQQIEDLKKALVLKANETEALLSTVNQLRSDHEQIQSQYQQYNGNVQRHVQELNEQINQLIQTNALLENEQEAIKKSYEMKIHEIQHEQSTNNDDLRLERESLIQENQLFKSAIDQWSQQYEQIRVQNEQLTLQSAEKDELINQLKETNSIIQEEPSIDHGKLLQTIHDDKATLSRALTQNKQLKDQLTELQDQFIKMSNDNMTLTNKIQAQEHLNKQLNERLVQKESPTNGNIEVEQPTENEQQLNELIEENKSLRERLSKLEQQPQTTSTNHDTSSLSTLSLPVEDSPQPQNGFIDKIIDRFNRAMRDNADLQDRAQQLEHLILQLQSETDTIGDYISLYQQQRQQLHRRYQEKDDYIKQLTHDRLNLQRKLSELETLLVRGLNSKTSIEDDKSYSDEIKPSEPEQQTQTTDENDWPEMLDNETNSSAEQATVLQDEKLIESSLPNFDTETKTRILELLKELSQPNNSSSQTDKSSDAKLAFIGKNLYVCSTCTGPVQWV